MIKRKLVMACLFVLAVQLARVCLLADTKDQPDDPGRRNS